MNENETSMKYGKGEESPMADSYESDPSLRVSFTPTAIREHLEGSDREEAIERLPDQLLAGAASEVMFSSQELWGLYGALCREIVERAEHAAEEHRRTVLLNQL